VVHGVVSASFEVHLAFKGRPHGLQGGIVGLLLGGLYARGRSHLQHIVPVALGGCVVVGVGGGGRGRSRGGGDWSE